MLFLGAGASKAIGLGDLRDLTVKVRKELDKRGYENMFGKITRRLESADRKHRFFNEGEIDLEVILSILNATVNRMGALKELGPFAIYLNTFTNKRKLSLHTKEDDLNKIRKIIGKVISRSLINYNKGKAKKYYQPLFQISFDLNHKYKTKTGHTSQPPLFEHIVTTNYDRIIENLYEDADMHGRPPRMGFKEDVRTQERYLDTDGLITGKYQYGTGNNHIEYLKLHGSIDWWVRRSDRQIIQREHAKSLRGERYPEQIMVYPVYEKHISQDPYFSLHYYFRNLLYYNDVYLVIGFSFRDPSINNAFRDALINKPASRMIVVSSNKKNIEKRLNDNFPKGKIDFVESQFGDNDLPSQIKDRLK